MGRLKVKLKHTLYSVSQKVVNNLLDYRREWARTAHLHLLWKNGQSYNLHWIFASGFGTPHSLCIWFVGKCFVRHCVVEVENAINIQHFDTWTYFLWCCLFTHEVNQICRFIHVFILWLVWWIYGSVLSYFWTILKSTHFYWYKDHLNMHSKNK